MKNVQKIHTHVILYDTPINKGKLQVNTQKIFKTIHIDVIIYDFNICNQINIMHN